MLMEPVVKLRPLSLRPDKTLARSRTVLDPLTENRANVTSLKECRARSRSRRFMPRRFLNPSNSLLSPCDSKNLFRTHLSSPEFLSSAARLKLFCQFRRGERIAIEGRERIGLENFNACYRLIHLEEGEKERSPPTLSTIVDFCSLFVA